MPSLLSNALSGVALPQWSYDVAIPPLQTSEEYTFVFFNNAPSLSPPLSILKEVKNPSTWSAIFYILIIYAFWQGNLNLIKILLLPTIAIYLLRQKREGSYNRSLREKALLKNWKYSVDKEYEKYKKDCFFKKIESKEQDLWRLDEIAQIRKDNN